MLAPILMHEGFDVDDPTKYTREWFSWANMMFCELVMDYFDIRVRKISISGQKREELDNEKTNLYRIS